MGDGSCLSIDTSKVRPVNLCGLLSCSGSWLKITVLCNLGLPWTRLCHFTGKLVCSLLVTVVGWSFVCLFLALLLFSVRFFFLLLSLSLSLSPVACAQEQARAYCCLSLFLSLDDLTMPPYSLPPSPKTRLLGTINFFWRNQQSWLWLVLLFLSFFCLCLFLSLLRDKDQGNRPHHTTQHLRERIFIFPFRRSRPLVFLFLPCVYQPHRYISVRVVSDLAGSL